ncbi:hypothetical protein DPMN_063972 [Dreissena polymorpha]|uniref:Uncharacterized protein n=1 Tax=Dreissena polymorpha TaxID=45954 RepID=A0A9D4CCC7_DREPO|nr:hypothetical protein DPMN_063972 [Dreissena polymorpha]
MPIKVMGRGAFRMQLGPVKRLQEAIVADIEDDVLLGYDVLGNAESPADIILSRSIISLDGKDIPCIQKRLRQMRKVTVADDVLVPGNSEAVIEVYVEREEADDGGKPDFIIEATDMFQERYGLVLAATLVNINSAPTCKVGLMNPFPEEAILKQDAEIARAERIDSVVSVVVDKESEDDAKELSIRRIDVTQSQGHESGKLEVIQHTIDKKDAAPAKQLYRRSLLIYSNVAVNAEEVTKKNYVGHKRTSPWVSRLVRVKKKFITSRDGRSLSLPNYTNESSDCSCHDYNVNETRISSKMVSLLMLDINFECDCDPGRSERGQTTDPRQCEPLHARGHSTSGIRRSSPRRMSFGPCHQRYQTIHSIPDVRRIDPPKTWDINFQFWKSNEIIR